MNRTAHIVRFYLAREWFICFGGVRPINLYQSRPRDKTESNFFLGDNCFPPSPILRPCDDMTRPFGLIPRKMLATHTSDVIPLLHRSGLHFLAFLSPQPGFVCGRFAGAKERNIPLPYLSIYLSREDSFFYSAGVRSVFGLLCKAAGDVYLNFSNLALLLFLQSRSRPTLLPLSNIKYRITNILAIILSQEYSDITYHL